jgi:hypothetical protein
MDDKALEELREIKAMLAEDRKVIKGFLERILELLEELTNRPKFSA